MSDQTKGLLAKAGSMWGKAPVAEAGGFKLPDGNYVVKLTDFKFTTTKNGALTAAYTMEIASGKYKGRKVTKFANLVTEMNYSYFKADLAALGIDPDDIGIKTFGEDVIKRMKKLIGKLIELRAYSQQDKDNSDLLRHNTAFVGLAPNDVDGEEEAYEEEEEAYEEEEEAYEEEEEAYEEEEEAPKKSAKVQAKKSKAPSRADVLAMSKDDIAATLKKSGERAIRGFEDMSVKEAQKALLARLGL